MHLEADKSLMDAVREIAPLIEKHRDEAERERRLSKPVLDALRETGLLKMATPESLGGLETDPITRALVVEEVGRLDSAAGWTLENPVDWAFFCARLPDLSVRHIFLTGHRRREVLFCLGGRLWANVFGTNHRVHSSDDRERGGDVAGGFVAPGVWKTELAQRQR